MPCGTALKCAEQLGFITSMIMQLKLPMSAVQILRLFCIRCLTDAKENGCVLVDSNFSYMYAGFQAFSLWLCIM